MNKTQKKIKNIGSSPLYIVSAVFLLIAAALAIFKFVTEPYYISESISFLIPGMTRSFVPDWYVYYLNFSTYPFLLIAATEVFTFIGMLCVYIFMVRKSKESCKLGFGMGFIKPMLIIKTVLIFAVLLIILSLQISYILPYFADLIDLGAEVPQYEITVFSVTLAVTVFIIVTEIIFVKKVYATSKAVNRTLKKGVIMGKVSVYLIVYNFIVCILSLALLLYTLIFDSGEYIMKAVILAFIISRLLSNFNIISMRSEMLYIKSRGYTS